MIKRFQSHQGLTAMYRRTQKRLKRSDIDGYRIEKYDFGYRYIPKTASSSLKRLLYEVECGKQFENMFLPNGRFTTVHNWVRKRRLASISSSKVRMIIIRDPIKRLLSAYADKVRKKKLISEAKVEERWPHLMGRLPPFNPSLSMFIKHLDDYSQIRSIRHHTMPLISFLNGKNLTFFTDVFKIEDLPLAVQKIQQITGSKLEIGRENTSGGKVSMADLTEEDIDRLIRYYADDYALLKGYYSPQDIKDEWRKSQNPSVKNT